MVPLLAREFHVRLSLLFGGVHEGSLRTSSQVDDRLLPGILLLIKIEVHFSIVQCVFLFVLLCILVLAGPCRIPLPRSTGSLALPFALRACGRSTLGLVGLLRHRVTFLRFRGTLGRLVIDLALRHVLFIISKLIYCNN